MIYYHLAESCNKCSSVNSIEITSFENGFVSEAKTECKECGFIDYWAYGFFNSSDVMISKCDKYYFDENNKMKIVKQDEISKCQITGEIND